MYNDLSVTDYRPLVDILVERMVSLHRIGRRRTDVDLECKLF